MGCVLQAGAGMNVARQAALKAGVPQEIPGETVNRVCGSGLQAVVHAVEATRVGYTDLVVAGGTESMTNAPYILKGARWGFRMGHGEVYDSMLLEGLTCAMGGCHMGITAENIASRFNVGREEQDAFAAESQRRAEAAIKGGLFRDEIVPVHIPQKKGDPIAFDTDEYPRAGTTAEKLGTLKPAFKKDGTVTAGNASGINDGAAAVVVATAERAAKLGRKPLAKILSFASTGVDPAIMGMGPVPAVTKALERAKSEGRRHRSLRAQRSVRGPIGRGREGARPERGEGEHARRCDRARSPHRRERRPRVDHADLRAADAGRREGCRVALHRRRHGHRHGHRGSCCLTSESIAKR